MTITGFLEARIAEDEYAIANSPKIGDMFDINRPFLPATLIERLQAECAAKRVILGNANYTALNALAAIYSDHPDYKRDWDS